VHQQLQLDAGKQQQQQHRVPPVSSQDPKVMGHGSTACQECGNQAKKDCTFQRCRTCCKSRDFDCATHVKSTWVPASKRRERQAAEAAAAAAGQPRPKSKRARILALAAPAGATTSMTTTSANSPRGSDINSGHPSQPAQARGGLPPEVRAQALFKCVRVTGVEDGENEFAYQATVKIGGHIFKGVLYDQGLDLAQQAVTSNPSELQLGGGGAGGVRSNLPSSSPLLDPSGMYGPDNTLLGGERPWFS
jgi:LRP1 type putative zinc finger protein